MNFATSAEQSGRNAIVLNGTKTTSLGQQSPQRFSLAPLSVIYITGSDMKEAPVRAVVRTGFLGSCSAAAADVRAAGAVSTTAIEVFGNLPKPLEFNMTRAWVDAPEVLGNIVLALGSMVYLEKAQL